MKVLMGWAMLFAAAGTIGKKILLGREVQRAMAWARADGEITKSKIVMKDSQAGMNSPNKTFKAEIIYKYTAGKRSYRNSRICLGGQLQLSLRGKAEDYCGRYPVGQTVSVYYDPDNPSDSCLERREETSIMYLVIGVVFAIVGIFFITG
ncbi:MAG: DUF3592 domain-containing protein [Candidatus Nitronauta litoralis]|uniref:DUF3592 domain-containing protein n=1 Tax=Candidatus Nitronauta litoralis TaxID=2705533 RepID=A0A7T0BUP4_9BACT|nr:MAG: DUF3592 domain-containing protein [Candidatus Nitronauta litoralis]